MPGDLRFMEYIKVKPAAQQSTPDKSASIQLHLARIINRCCDKSETFYRNVQSARAYTNICNSRLVREKFIGTFQRDFAVDLSRKLSPIASRNKSVHARCIKFMSRRSESYTVPLLNLFAYAVLLDRTALLIASDFVKELIGNFPRGRLERFAMDTYYFCTHAKLAPLRRWYPSCPA